MANKKIDSLPTLEKSLTEISELINKMEHSELTLEQSLQNFERGVTLIKHCQTILNTAEQKVKILMQDKNSENLIPFNEQAEIIEENKLQEPHA